MKFHLPVCAGVLLSLLLVLSANAKDGELPRGSLHFKAADAKKDGNTLTWNFHAERWGMYEVRVAYDSAVETSGTVTLGDTKFGDTFPKGTNHIENLGPRYLAGQWKQSIEVFTDANVKYVLLTPAYEGEEVVQKPDEDGNILLDSNTALTHSVKMRYEPKSVKLCLGFWTHKEDWAEWQFEIEEGGTYDVQITQGCGKDNGGSNVKVEAGDDQSFTFEVEDTGGWQNWKDRKIGTITLKPGQHSFKVRPQTLANKAVMDIRRIRLLKSE